MNNEKLLTNGTSVAIRKYALNELARRAGVQQDFLDSWKVHYGPEDTRISFNDSAKTISLAHNTNVSWQQLLQGDVRTVRMTWPSGTPPAAISWFAPDLIIPFVFETSSQSDTPLFTADADLIRCEIDILTSIFISLTRLEEEVPGELDHHSRFPLRRSAAYKGGFLHRPVVDETGFAFEWALHRACPAWQPTPRKGSYLLTHDVDHVGTQFNMKSIAGHLLRRHNPLAAFQDTAGRLFGTNPAYTQCLLDLVKYSAELGLQPSVYLQSSPPSPFDAGYRLEEPILRGAIEELGRLGAELGTHPGYYTYNNPEQLTAEIENLRTNLPYSSIGGRQHYLRWSPNTWSDWEACGLRYDSSVGYSEASGFRAGTAYGYHPWLVLEGRPAKLMEFPLIVMDTTVLGDMTGEPDAIRRESLLFLRQCQAVGGTFTLLLHPNHYAYPRNRAPFRETLNLLSSSSLTPVLDYYPN